MRSSVILAFLILASVPAFTQGRFATARALQVCANGEILVYPAYGKQVGSMWTGTNISRTPSEYSNKWLKQFNQETQAQISREHKPLAFRRTAHWLQGAVFLIPERMMLRFQEIEQGRRASWLSGRPFLRTGDYSSADFEIALTPDKLFRHRVT
ncbi:MAG: hypothetical protein WAT74_11965, partial [Flavobacteriales bacterium]